MRVCFVIRLSQLTFFPSLEVYVLCLQILNVTVNFNIKEKHKSEKCTVCHHDVHAKVVRHKLLIIDLIKTWQTP